MDTVAGPHMHTADITANKVDENGSSEAVSKMEKAEVGMHSQPEDASTVVDQNSQASEKFDKTEGSDHCLNPPSTNSEIASLPDVQAIAPEESISDIKRHEHLDSIEESSSLLAADDDHAKIEKVESKAFEAEVPMASDKNSSAVSTQGQTSVISGSVSEEQHSCVPTSEEDTNTPTSSKLYLPGTDVSNTGCATTATPIPMDLGSGEQSLSTKQDDTGIHTEKDVAAFSMFRNLSGEGEETSDMALASKACENGISTPVSQLSEIPDDPSLVASDCLSVSQSPIGTPSTSVKETEEDTELSQSSRNSSRKRPLTNSKLAVEKDGEDGTVVDITADKIFEYQWPNEKGAEYFVLQEQISEYLGVVSFKRKHRDLQRRPVEPRERTFLREKNIVTEMQCDLGLTALRSEEVYDLMARDYPEKFKDVAEMLHRRERQRICDDHKGYEMPNIEKSKMTSFIKKAVQSAAEFNALFNRERREERQAYFDLQTMEVHWPCGRYKKLPPELTKPSPYPVALIPGQFQEYYKQYSAQELKYLPLKTTMYSPPRAVTNIYADPEGGSEDEEDQAADERVIASLNEEASSGSDSSSDDSDDDTTTGMDSESASQKSERSIPQRQMMVLPPVTSTPTRTPTATLR